MGKRIWEISPGRIDPIFIIQVESPKGKERYSYEHYQRQDSVFRGNVTCSYPLSKSQFNAVMRILEDLGVPAKYLGER